MSSILDLIIPFFMALIIALSGYIVALISDWMQTIIIPLLVMLLFDLLTVYMFYAINTTKIQLMMGVILGITLKIIVFLLYQKYLSNE